MDDGLKVVVEEVVVGTPAKLVIHGWTVEVRSGRRAKRAARAWQRRTSAEKAGPIQANTVMGICDGGLWSRPSYEICSQ